MIYRGPGFFAVVRFGDLAPPPPLSPVSKLSLFLNLPVNRRSSLPKGGWEEGVGGAAESYGGEKAWFSINHSLLSSLLWVCIPMSGLAWTQYRWCSYQQLYILEYTFLEHAIVRPHAIVDVFPQ